MNRDRWDGADIAHLIHSCAEKLDWQRLLQRFGDDWRLLLCNLILFGFIYPCERDRVPKWLMQELFHRLQQDMQTPPPKDPICQGTLISGTEFLFDLQEWGYQDARRNPLGSMTAQEIQDWTTALQEKQET